MTFFSRQFGRKSCKKLLMLAKLSTLSKQSKLFAKAKINPAVGFAPQNKYHSVSSFKFIPPGMTLKFIGTMTMSL